MMRSSEDLLLYKYDLSAVLRNNLAGAAKALEAVPERQFLQSSDEKVAEHLGSKLEVLPIALHEDRMVQEILETQVDVRYDWNRAVFDQSKPCLVPGTRILVTIPFSGDANLWHCRPSSFDLNPPRAHVEAGPQNESGTLNLVVERPTDTLSSDEVKREMAKSLESVKGYLEWVNRDVMAHNEQLRSEIGKAIKARRARLGRHAELAKVLDIPLKPRPGAPGIEPLPVKRRIVQPLPSRSQRPPEPGISDDIYEYILKIIRHEGRTFEATPKTFARHDEEELRDILLAHLNGHLEGKASGETFRKTGKTDIQIQQDNRAAFIAECKVWRGDKQLLAAVDQLLGYLTWRDCKTALILFNLKNAGFADIQEKLPTVLGAHPQFQAALSSGEAGEWRFRMRSPEDDQRSVTVHVFLFNLFSRP
ncbi:MAG: hypothetical protein WAO20_03535 [Acidobacteriota bacterium]